MLISQRWFVDVCEFKWKRRFCVRAFFSDCAQHILFRLTCIAFEMRYKRPYNRSLVGCCFQNLLKTARSILGLSSSSFPPLHQVNVQVVQQYIITKTPTVLKKLIHFIIDIGFSYSYIISSIFQTNNFQGIVWFQVILI